MTRIRKTLKFGIGAVLASAVIAGSLVSGEPTPASAAVEPTHTWTFTNPSGANWIVPAGVEQVWVGIHGGTGGFGSSFPQCRTGSSGNQFSVLLDVQAGDTITTFAGQSAWGKGDQRMGGKGFLDGGDGGTKSLTSSPGGGGGGAGAVKLNGELIAVAGGGGGCGGDSGYYPNTRGGFDSRGGGEGGFPSNLNFGDGKDGEGKHPGRGGSAGKDDPSFVGYHKPGIKGSNAGVGSSGGGGGGGGAGYPSSGDSGGAGRKFAGFNGGGGGGAGLSWVKAGIVKETFTQPEDSHYEVSIPAAKTGESKITIPLTTATKISGPQTVKSDESVNIRVQTGAWGQATSMLDGSFKLLVDGVEVPASNPGEPLNTRYKTTGDYTVTLPPLSTGTHTVTAEFAPTSDQAYWNSQGYLSSDSMSITVSDPDVIPDDDDKADTKIDLTLPQGKSYGDSGEIGIELALDGTGGTSLGVEGVLSLALDGVDIYAETMTAGVPSFSKTVPLPATLAAGEHRVSAAFTGSSIADGSTTGTLRFTLAQAATATTLLPPAPVTSGTPVSVTAEVASPVSGLTGTVALLADDLVLTEGALQQDGTVAFPAVRIPAGTSSLSARFLGDSDGNFSISQSDPAAYQPLDADTRTTLELSASEVKFGQPVTLTGTVMNLSDDDDPLGEVEVLSNGQVVETIPIGLDIDPDTSNAKSVFEMDIAHLAPGSYNLHARFVPSPGFSASSTATPQTLRVLGIGTKLTAQATTGTAQRAATATVEARDADGGKLVDGVVEAFVPADTRVGAAVAAANPTATDLPAAPAGMRPVGQPTAVDAGVGTVELTGLPAGTHEVTLRFTPHDEGHLESSALVKVEVTAPHGGNDGATRPDTLSRTGSDSTPLGLLAAALLLVGSVSGIIAVRRRQRSAQD